MPSSHKNPALAAKIAQMALPLAPLVRLNTGAIHPSFPSTLLNFWLLTSDQMDDLAHFYHQGTPSIYTRHYPCPVDKEWRNDASLEEKRRRIGRFGGLRGCESPVLDVKQRQRGGEREKEHRVEGREGFTNSELEEIREWEIMEAEREEREMREMEARERELLEREIMEKRWMDEEEQLMKKKMRWYY